MPIQDPMELNAYAQMAEQAYQNQAGSTPDVLIGSSSYVEFYRAIDQFTGFQARAFYNSQLNEVVIAFSGTEGAPGNIQGFNPFEFAQDLTTNVGVGLVGAGLQAADARTFTRDALDALNMSGAVNYDVTLVGHSLGGFLAQATSLQNPINIAAGIPAADNVVLFNSPGVGGFAELPVVGALPEDHYTYVYSPSTSWGPIATTVHSLGYTLSDNLFVVATAIDHAIATTGGIPPGISDALTGDPLTTSDVVPVTSVSDFEFGDTNEIVAGIVALTGLLSVQDLLELDLNLDEIEDLLDMAGDSANLIEGTSAGETLTGTDGNDYIISDAGDDTLTGGDGVDTFYFYDNDGTDTITDFDIDNDRIKINGDFVNPLSQPSGINVFESGSDVHVTYTGGTVILTGVDFAAWAAVAPFYTPQAGGSATGDSGDNIMIGDDGVDVLYGLAGDDKIYAGPDGDFLYGGQGNDLAAGNTGDDYIEGNRGNDFLKGDQGADALLGGGGNDYLYGDEDNDKLDGGNGIDILYGGAGADIFVFSEIGHISNSSGRDSIRDFDRSEDIINLASIGGLSFNNSDAAGTVGFRLSNSGTNSVIEGHIDEDGIVDFEIFVQGVTNLDASDFDFTNMVTYDEYVLV